MGETRRIPGKTSRQRFYKRKWPKKQSHRYWFTIHHRIIIPSKYINFGRAHQSGEPLASE